MERKERQELWCHACDRYVQFDLDLGINGYHVVVCPNCSHRHYRVVDQGRITGFRWPFWTSVVAAATGCTASAHSVYQSIYDSSDCSYLAGAWYNTTSGT